MFESDMASYAVQSRRRHFRAWKNARSVARVPLALRGGRGGLCVTHAGDQFSGHETLNGAEFGTGIYAIQALELAAGRR